MVPAAKPFSENQPEPSPIVSTHSVPNVVPLRATVGCPLQKGYRWMAGSIHTLTSVAVNGGSNDEG